MRQGGLQHGLPWPFRSGPRCLLTELTALQAKGAGPPAHPRRLPFVLDDTPAYVKLEHDPAYPVDALDREVGRQGVPHEWPTIVDGSGQVRAIGSSTQAIAAAASRCPL
jgi:hypothetical protein